MKILIYDIETFANLGYVWGKYEQNVIRYAEEWFMLCFAYKWLGQKQTHVVSLPDFPLYKKNKKNDIEILKVLWKLLDEADVVIAHNGDQFDIKKTNARFIAHGMTPPSPYKTIDTKKVAKRYFKFNSNKLDDLGEHLGLGRKIQTGGFDLWMGCYEGDMKAWKKMIAYNKQDVKLLEDVYLKMRPWIKAHPNHNLVDPEKKVCPNCGSDKLQKRGFDETRVSTFQKYCCKSCGAWPRARLAEKITKPEIV